MTICRRLLNKSLTINQHYITVVFVSNTARANTPEFVSSSHMAAYLHPESLRCRLRLAARALRTHNFDTLAFRGMSGAFLGPALAARLKKEMILVRKPNDTSHSEYPVEGNKKAARYIIVDDFIATGDTRECIIEAVREFAPQATFVGLLQVSYIEGSGFKRKGKYRLATRRTW